MTISKQARRGLCAGLFGGNVEDHKELAFTARMALACFCNVNTFIL